MGKINEKTKKKVKTRCEVGPPQDIVPNYVARAKEVDKIEFKLTVCKANARIVVYLDEDKLIDESSKDEISLLLPKLPLGVHRLYWSILEAGEEWQTRAEIKVNETVCFLRRRKCTDNNPVLAGFWYVEVIQ